MVVISRSMCDHPDLHKKKVIVEDVQRKDNTYKWDIHWPNTIALVLLHAIAVYVRYNNHLFSFNGAIFGKALSVFAMISTTAGAHRFWCHKTYKTNIFVQIVMMIGISTIHQNSIYTWCRDHRVHHKYSETDADPHNAKRGLFFSHVGWLMVRKNDQVKEKGKLVDLSDLRANPVVMFQHKYYWLIFMIFGVFVPVFVPYYFLGESLMISLLHGTIYRYVMVINLIWTVNSLAHKFGNKPYDKNIGPVESVFCKVATGGEGFHNYHHTFPWDYKAAEFGNDARNLATHFINFLAYFGWAYDLKTVPPSIIERRARLSGDDTRKDDDVFLLNRLPYVLQRVLINTFQFSMFWLLVYVL